MRTYNSRMRYADFPLGGIGTGTVTLNAAGQLKDFQWFNRPSLGEKVPYTFFAMHSEWGGNSDTRALEAYGNEDLYRGRGCHPKYTAGLPKFEKSEMAVRYPFATIDFQEEAFPIRVRLEAFNPFLPLRAADSGIPAAYLRYRVTNGSAENAEILIAGSMGNIHNWHTQDNFDNPFVSDRLRNEQRTEHGFSGVFMTGDAVPEDDLCYSNNALIAVDPCSEVRAEWYEGGWYDGITDFWNNLTKGILKAGHETAEGELSVGPRAVKVGSVGIRKTLASGESADFGFVMAWYVPNRVRGWFPEQNPGRTMRNYYATVYRDAWHAGCDLIRRFEELEAGSRLFADALYSSTLPEAMLDAVASNIAVLRSTTCWRAEDGTFLAWEGSHEQSGSCQGTCTHVWNYAQTVAFLFPELERTARINEFTYETNPDGKMTFRCQRRFGLPDWGMYPAADGQLGTIIRAWREWRLSGDREYLDTVYPHVLRAFDFALKEFDPDGDGVPEARQHNTYDIEFYGPNPLSAVMLLGAAKAVIALAKERGDTERVKETEGLFQKAQENFDRICWQGEYYVQRLNEIDRCPYQFGTGCLSDMLFGQTLAYVSGLGRLLPEERLRSAAEAIFRYNFRDGRERRPCLQRLYVEQDEKGLVLCSWPNGGVPRFPFVYSDEVWTGIEYQVATLLIWEGLTGEAEELVRAVRERFDGIRRAPFNEMECGFYYTRAMASWGLLIAYSGFDCNAAKGYLHFRPRTGEGTFFWSMGDAWGTAAFRGPKAEIRILQGSLKLNELSLPVPADRAELNGREVPFGAEGSSMIFDGIPLESGDVLVLEQTKREKAQ